MNRKEMFYISRKIYAKLYYAMVAKSITNKNVNQIVSHNINAVK